MKREENQRKSYITRNSPEDQNKYLFKEGDKSSFLCLNLSVRKMTVLYGTGCNTQNSVKDTERFQTRDFQTFTTAPVGQTSLGSGC